MRQDKTIINRIMQRFRPIAPKPATEGSHVASVGAEFISTRRRKRKYVRVKKNNNKPRFSKAVDKRDRTFGHGYVDDAFLSSTSSGVRSEEKRSFTVLSFTPDDDLHPTYAYPPKPVDSQSEVKFSVQNVSDLGVETPPRKVVESWLVADSMTTETCHDDVAELGNNDTERMMNLGMDTCPGLISDGDQKVKWINHAYQQMVAEERDGNEEVVVNLALREKIPDRCQVFTCNVRVMYNNYSQTMPCDVWRMDYGGFAWRLDATAALKLGR